MTSLSNRVVQITSPPNTCQYNDINLIKDSNKCTKGENSGLFYITLNNISYSLSTSSRNYLDVCKTLCTSFNSLTKDCKANATALSNFNNCEKSLQPSGSCSGLERPLGFRFSKTGKKIFFYAKDIIQINNCI